MLMAIIKMTMKVMMNIRENEGGTVFGKYLFTYFLYKRKKTFYIGHLVFPVYLLLLLV